MHRVEIEATAPRPVPMELPTSVDAVPAVPVRAAHPPVPRPVPVVDATEAFNFEAPTLDGGRFSLRDHRGKIVMLDIFSVHCGYCFREIDDLATVVKAHPNDVVFVGIALESEDEIRAATKHKSFPFPLISDADQRVLPHYPSEGTPTHVIIDRAGRYYSRSVVSGAHGPKEIEAAIAYARRPPPKVKVSRAVDIDGECALEGVLQRVDGSPVAKTRLAFQLDSERSSKQVTTDASGHFVLRSMACGRYSTFASAAGLSATSFHVESKPAGQLLEPLVMHGLGTVTGVVVDAAGAPVAGALVTECRFERQRTSTTTDTQGQFRLSGVTIGRSSVIARMPSAEGGSRVEVELDETMPVATRVELRTGRIIGTVAKHKATKRPLFVRADPITGGGCEEASPETSVKDDGTFELTLAPGRYVMVLFEQFFEWSNPTRAPVTVLEAHEARVDSLVDSRP